MTSQETQQTQQTQTQAIDGYNMYDKSFDISAVIARLVSTVNTERFQNIIIPRKEPNHLFKFGRHKACDFILPGVRFSNVHFQIQEQSCETSKYGERHSVVIVQDTSTNGTFLNQVRIGKGQTSVLCNGDELAAGLGVPEDEVRYVVQLPKQARPKMSANLTAEAIACMEKYEIRQTLGSGAFATVRLAVDRNTGTQYAVKILNQQKLAMSNMSAKGTQLFKREIGILQSTKHPNIVQYVDMWTDDSDIFLVLEYMPGGDLMTCIQNNRLLPEHYAIGIIRQLLEALVYCHGLGIAHRDIKPENILMTLDNPPIVKLTDFGLAKMVEPGSFLKTFCGTLTYVAPEVISMDQRVQGTYSAAVDMWSVGCVAYVMVAGVMPFAARAESQDDVMKAIKEGNYDEAPLDEVELSGPGVDFIESLLRVKPTDRLTGEQALKHPWLDPRNSIPAESDEMDHESQDTSSQEVQRLRIAGRPESLVAQASSLVEPAGSQQPSSAIRHDFTPFDVDSIDWSRVDEGRGLQYQPAEKQAYIAQLQAQGVSADGMWNISHFSADSSANFLGSSKYVSAISEPRNSDSAVTITPQRLRDARQQGIESTTGTFHTANVAPIFPNPSQGAAS